MSDKLAQVQIGCIIALFQNADPCETLPCKYTAETPHFVQVKEDILLVCNSESLKFRAGTSSKAILARARETWGPGKITDKEGYQVTDESPVLVNDQYDYHRSSAGKTQSIQLQTVNMYGMTW